MRRGIFGTPIAPAFNAVAAKLIDVPLLGNVVRRNLVVISYVGRRSGKTFTTPVNYRRVGDDIVIHVGLPGCQDLVAKLPGRRRPDYAAAQRHRPNRARRRDPRRSGPGDRHGQATDFLFSRNRLNDRRDGAVQHGHGGHPRDQWGQRAAGQGVGAATGQAHDAQPLGVVWNDPPIP